MKCRMVKQNLVAYVAGELPASEQAAIAAHVEACADCRAELAAFRRAEDALRTLAVVEAAPDLTADLHQRVAARATRSVRSRWAYGTLAAMTAAAALVIWLHRASPPPKPVRGAAQVARRSPNAQARPQPTAIPRSEVKVSPAPALAHEPRRTALVRKRSVRHRVANRPAANTDMRIQDGSRPQTVIAGLPEARGPEAPVGIVLLLGSPEEPAPSSSCYIEVSMPDGTRSIQEQDVQRDADGNPLAIRIAYEQMAPEAPGPNRGG